MSKAMRLYIVFAIIVAITWIWSVVVNGGIKL